MPVTKYWAPPTTNSCITAKMAARSTAFACVRVAPWWLPRPKLATWLDYNGDGWPDLYVANDFAAPDCFYRNNGDGTFTSVLATAVPHTTWFSMGSDSADINNDGQIGRAHV